MNKKERIQWWRESRFGMFIHWGIYSILGRGEWAMHNEQIPVKKYEKLTDQFNPLKFDAYKWVRLAKDTGMKYIIITAKHHDGFAMFNSSVSEYNIVDATPFARDPMKELADACKQEGIKLGFYYSQAQDWHAHSVGEDWVEKHRQGEECIISTEDREVFKSYLKKKVKPQLKELIVQYKPSIIWFDTPYYMTKEESKEIAVFVRKLDSKCLINSRIINDYEYPEGIYEIDIDYYSMGDNEIPSVITGKDWETPMTSCRGWGYIKEKNNEWKSPQLLLDYLIDIVSKEGNYLLNVGPTPEGIIPEEAVDILDIIGKWMEVNKESIYGTKGNPFYNEFRWGTVTWQPGKIYLHILNQPEDDIVIYGLENKIKASYLLADTNEKVLFKQKYDQKLKCNVLQLTLPSSLPDKYDSVVVLEIEEDVEVEFPVIQKADRSINLNAPVADIHTGSDESLIWISPSGVIDCWLDKNDWVSWDFKVLTPGDYDLYLVLRAKSWYKEKWDFGHKLNIKVGGEKLKHTVFANQGTIDGKGAHQIKKIKVGTVNFSAPGVYELEVKPEKIYTENGWGLRLQSIDMIPV